MIRLMRGHWKGCAVVVTLLAIAGAVYGVVSLVRAVPVEALEWWAVLATLALPAAGVGGWLLGRFEAGATLAGLDRGVDAVMGAAQRTAELRVATRRAAREKPPRTGPNLNVFLPDAARVPTVTRRAIGPGDEVIDL